MSAQSAIDNLLATLRGLSGWTSAEAAALAAQAGSVIAAVEVGEAEAFTFEVDREAEKYKRVPRPPTLAPVPPIQIPPLGALQDIDQTVSAFEGIKPTLNPPPFDYPPLPETPTFTDRAPNSGTAAVHPRVPALNPPTAPTLTVPKAVTADPPSGDPPELPILGVGAFDGDVFAEYEKGLELAAPSVTAWVAWVSGMRAQWLPTESALVAALTAGLAGSGALPSSWERARSDQGRQEVLGERWADLDAFDAAPSSATGLPAGNRRAALLAFEMKATRGIARAAAEAANARQESAAHHRQWAAELAVRWGDAAIRLRAQEGAWRMKGFEIALDGAAAAVGLLADVLALQVRTLEFHSRYNAGQVKRAEFMIQIELGKLEPMRLAIASNALTLEHDQRATQVYQIAAGLAEARVGLFEARIAALQTDIGWRTLELRGFEAEIDAYRATVGAKKAEYAALQAQIKGDLAEVEAELGKVRLYSAEAKAKAADAEAKAAAAQARAAQNRGQLDAYNATLDAQTAALRSLDAATKLALTALTKGFVAENAEQELKLRQQALADQDTLQEAVRDLAYEKVDLLNRLHAQAAKVAQAAAHGAVIAQGAKTLSGIATHAFADMNAVGTAEAVAYATS